VRKVAYKQTSVAVDRSQGHIRKLLIEYGAKAVQFTDEFTENKVQMRFRYDVDGVEGPAIVYFVRMEAQVPQPKEKIRYKHRSLGVIRKEKDQNMKATWRAIYWALKSRMESIGYGIETFEQAFLAHFEAGLDEMGRAVTIGERLIPRLRQGQLALPPPQKK